MLLESVTAMRILWASVRDLEQTSVPRPNALAKGLVNAGMR